MAKGSGAGQNVAMLFVLLAILAGAGSWNYKRNLEAEAAQPRPYKSYSDEQLEQLRSAYEAQVDALSKRYDAASGKRSRQQEVQLLGEAVSQFDRVQQSSRAVRDLGSKLSQEMASLDAIEEEQALRKRLGGPTAIFLRRVFLPPGLG
jgi:hypothetical protein